MTTHKWYGVGYCKQCNETTEGDFCSTGCEDVYNIMKTFNSRNSTGKSS